MKDRRQTSPDTAHYPFFSKNDINGFWALFADNLANMVLVAYLCTAVINIPARIVFGRILPGLGVALLAGLSFYSWQAHRLAKREGRNDVTALPYGISTPILFVYLFAVMLPVKIVTGDPVKAWQVGVAAAFIGGIIEALGSVLGPWLKKITPRAGMLGTLAGIALVWIAAVPMAEILEHPHIGLPALALILVGLIGGHRLPFGIPAGLAAIVIGTGIGLFSGDAEFTTKGLALHPPIPVIGDLFAGLKYIFENPSILLIVAPLEIYNFIETMNNVESAEAAGDKYNVGLCQLADGGGTIVGAIFGSAFPTTVYIGHPAYKRLGARAGYALGVGVVFILAAVFGFVTMLHSLVPIAAVAPLLIFVAMAICSQAFGAVEKRHMPAVALAMVPHVGDIIYKKAVGVTGGVAEYLSSGMEKIPEALQARIANLRLPNPETVSELNQALLQTGGIHLIGQGYLSRGAIITGLLWGAMVAFIIDKKYLHACYFTIAATLLTLLGFIHSGNSTMLNFNTLTLGYSIMALMLFAISRTSQPDKKPAPATEKSYPNEHTDHEPLTDVESRGHLSNKVRAGGEPKQHENNAYVFQNIQTDRNKGKQVEDP